MYTNFIESNKNDFMEKAWKKTTRYSKVSRTTYESERFEFP